MNIPLQYIYLYDDPESPGLDIDYLAPWLASVLPDANIGVRTDYLTHQLARFPEEERDQLVATLCEQLEGIEIRNLVRPEDREKLPELRPEDRDLDVVYEATALQAILRLLLPPDESRLSHLHIAFTSHYLGAWRPDDPYLKLRAAVLGIPNLISTSGLVEALELPKQYHFMRQQLALLGVEEDIEEVFADQTLGYGDPRLNEICKGYLMQAVFYRLTGETGCAEPQCRLHLDTTHAAMMRTQVLQRPRLCPRHSDQLRGYGGEPE